MGGASGDTGGCRRSVCTCTLYSNKCTRTTQRNPRPAPIQCAYRSMWAVQAAIEPDDAARHVDATLTDARARRSGGDGSHSHPMHDHPRTPSTSRGPPLGGESIKDDKSGSTGDYRNALRRQTATARQTIAHSRRNTSYAKAKAAGPAIQRAVRAPHPFVGFKSARGMVPTRMRMQRARSGPAVQRRRKLRRAF